MTAEEIAEIEARVAAADLNFNEVRMLRSGMLSASDWTQMVDSALTDEKKAEWATYRQELRDHPAQSDRVSTLPDWPTPPE